MQEHFFPLGKVLKGLRPTEAEYANTGHAVEAANMQADEAAIQTAEWPPDAGAGDLSADMSWPICTLHDTPDGWLVMGADNLASEWASDVDLSVLATGPWSVGQLGQNLVATAPGVPYPWFYNSELDTWSQLSVSAEFTRVPEYASCLCDFYGQIIVYGGVLDVNMPDTFSDGSGSLVAWSKPLSPALGIMDITEDSVVNQAIDHRNDGGWIYVVGVGDIQAVRPLGRDLVVFGTKGVAMLSSWQTPGWAQTTVSDVGIRNASAVAGDYSGGALWYIDQKGSLWQLTAKKFERLHYDEFLGASFDWVLTYDHAATELYLSTTDKHYRYRVDLGAMTGPNDGNLQVTGHVGTKSFRLEGIEAVQPVSMWVSDVLDMARHGYKTLRWVQVFGDIPSDAQTAVDYRYDMGGAFTRSNYIPLSPHNSVHSGVTAPEMRVVIKSQMPGLKVTGIHVRWQAADKRFIRGKSARLSG